MSFDPNKNSYICIPDSSFNKLMKIYDARIAALGLFKEDWDNEVLNRTLDLYDIDIELFSDFCKEILATGVDEFERKYFDIEP